MDSVHTDGPSVNGCDWYEDRLVDRPEGKWHMMLWLEEGRYRRQAGCIAGIRERLRGIEVLLREHPEPSLYQAHLIELEAAQLYREARSLVELKGQVLREAMPAILDDIAGGE